MAQKPRRPAGRTYEIARVVSVGRDRETNGAVVTLRDEDGRMIALRLWQRQARTLANGLAGFVASIDE